MLGIDNPACDAELAAVAASFFAGLGLLPSHVQIMVNSRQLADQRLSELGIQAERRQEIYHLIDRRERMSHADWDAFAREQGADDELLKGLHAMLSDKDAWEHSEALTAFFQAAAAMGVGEYLQFDPSVIRGLDYYTGTVFEARDVLGEHRAILGGGRYDNLVADVGGDSVPAVGFAMGDVVIGLVLEQAGVTPKLGVAPAQILITNFSAELMAESLALGRELRQAGFKVEWYPEESRLGKQFKYADRYGIPAVAIIGPDKSASGSVTMRDMRSGEQMNIPRADAGERLRRLLG